MFWYLDQNGDGVLERGDYDRMCRNLLRVLEPAAGSKQAAEIEDSYAVEWNELEAEAQQEGRAQVTLEGWLAYRGRQLEGPRAFETMILPYVETVLALLDRDGDGRVSVPEVRRYLSLYGMPAADLDEILSRINPARRDSFSWEEIGQLAKEYYFSDDENAPGSWLLGRF
jgi:Ca2+-binding EF-hand superfamily protein